MTGTSMPFLGLTDCTAGFESRLTCTLACDPCSDFLRRLPGHLRALNLDAESDVAPDHGMPMIPNKVRATTTTAGIPKRSDATENKDRCHTSWTCVAGKPGQAIDGWCSGTGRGGEPDHYFIGAEVRVRVGIIGVAVRVGRWTYKSGSREYEIINDMASAPPDDYLIILFVVTVACLGLFMTLLLGKRPPGPTDE